MNCHLKYRFIAIFVLAAMILAPEIAQAQGGPKTPTGPTPRLTNGKPDFSGMWQKPYVPDMTRSSRPDASGALPEVNQKFVPPAGDTALPFTAWGKKNAPVADGGTYDPEKDGDYTGSCMPFGLVRSINTPEPMQIIQGADSFAFLFEQNSWFHVVHMNGEHPQGRDVVPTWFGHSIGKWDGDTLVIDTVGFNGYTRLDTNGHAHSDQLHVVQTLRRPDLGHLQYTITIDDPKAFTAPWKNERTFVLRPDWSIMEYSCEENNKDIFDGHIKAWRPPVEEEEK